jgi:hypothetical protein
MRPARLLALAAGAALAGAGSLAAAQQPAPVQKAAPAQKAASRPVQSAVYYDSYEASRRRPSRSSGCRADAEQTLGSFCVRKCKAGYAALDDRKAGVRQCRSTKPLPPGELPTSGKKETSQNPPQYRPSAPSKPGV